MKVIKSIPFYRFYNGNKNNKICCVLFYKFDNMLMNKKQVNEYLQNKEIDTWRLRIARLGLSESKFAKIAGISQPTISNAINHVKDIQSKTFYLITTALEEMESLKKEDNNSRLQKFIEKHSK